MTGLAARLRAFARFWYDFVVGDDWRVAIGVVVGLAVCALLADTTVGGWWVMPGVVVAVLAASLRRATRATHNP